LKLRVFIVFTAALFASPQTGAATPGWKPDRQIEIIVNTAPGASPDRTARTMERIFRERKFVEMPIVVANRVGGGGAVAFTYLNQKPGDGHFLAIASKAILTNNLMGRGPHHGEFTPVAHLFGEYIVIAVKADSPIRSGRDLIERLKKDPGAHSFGIATSLGNINHQSVAAAMKEAGIDLRKTKNAVFQASIQAHTAMLGGHVDVVPMVLGTAVQPLQAGQIRLLAITSPKRAPGVFAEVPTWTEQGYHVVTSNWRSVVGPRALSADQLAYWERATRQLVETDDWKKDLEKSHLSGEYLNSAETKKMMDSDYAKVKAFLGELELVK
jgi:putative tricarboxylic transport membrane protein